MQPNKILTGFAKIKQNYLSDVTLNIINKLTNNPYYPNPSPALNVVQEACKEFSEALVKYIHGDVQDTIIKNAKMKALQQHLTHLGHYINSASEGDLVKLGSSGFQISKPREAVGFLSAPEFFKVTDGENPGELYFSMSSVKKANGYIVLYAQFPAPANNGDWHSKVLSKSTGWIGGLEVGRKYLLKAAATSPEADNMSVYNFTQVVERFVQ
ncbi:MAG: hypothetical protein WCR55_12785 [Lentisphaerota bacterium]